MKLWRTCQFNLSSTTAQTRLVESFENYLVYKEQCLYSSLKNTDPYVINIAKHLFLPYTFSSVPLCMGNDLKIQQLLNNENTKILWAREH